VSADVKAISSFVDEPRKRNSGNFRVLFYFAERGYKL
jgi:hypothetical protein